MKTITSKIIHEKLSEGWGFTQLAEYLGFENNDGLVEAINKQFNRQARRDFISRLEKNEKRFNRLSRKTEDTSAEPSHEVENAHEPAPSCAEADSDTDSRIKTLTSMIEDSKKVLIKQESMLKTLHANRDEAQDKLREYSESLCEITKRLENLKRLVTKEDQHITALTHRIEQVLSEKAGEEAHLVKMEAELQALQTCEIYVGDDGQITDGADQPYEIPTDWEKEFSTLLDSQLADDYMVREIRLAAKVIALVAALDDYVILVDSDRVATLLIACDVPVST